MENNKKTTLLNNLIQLCLTVGILCIGGLIWYILLEIASNLFILHIGTFYDAVVEFAACIGFGAVLYFVKKILNVTVSK